MRLLIFILIIILIFFIIPVEQISKPHKSKYEQIKPHLISKTHKNILLRTLKNTHDIFEKNNIFYVMEGGVLLGAVRDKSLIPWDDDADLLVLIKDQDKIMNLRKDFWKFGHDIKRMDRLLRIFCIKGRNYPFIDLFINDQINNSLLDPKYRKLVRNNDLIRCTGTLKPEKYECIGDCCVYPGSVKWWWKYNFRINDLFPRKKYKLNNITLYGPNNPYPYINTWYGKSALNTYKFTHNHKSHKKKPKKVTFSKEEFNEMKKHFFK